MAAKGKGFSFDLGLDNLSKGLGLTKAMNKTFDSTNKAISKMEGHFEKMYKMSLKIKDNLSSKAEAFGAAPNKMVQSLKTKAIGAAHEGKPLKANIIGAGASGLAKGFAMASKAAGLFGVALMAIGKIVWIQILTAAIIVFKRAWDANIGGIQRQFGAVMGKVMDTVGQVIAAFYKFVDQLAPVLEPFFQGIADYLMPIIEGVGTLVTQFLKGGGAAGVFGDIIMPVLESVWELITTVMGVLGELFASLSTGGKDGESTFGRIFKSVGILINFVIKLASAIIKLLDKLGLFKAIAFIFDVIGYAIEGVVTIIVTLVDWIIKAVDWLGKLAFWNKESDKEKEEAAAKDKARSDSIKAAPASKEVAVANNTTNQRSSVVNSSPVITVNTSGNITPENAPYVADTIAQRVLVQRGTV